MQQAQMATVQGRVQVESKQGGVRNVIAGPGRRTLGPGSAIRPWSSSARSSNFRRAAWAARPAGAPLDDALFIPVADSDYEAARVPVTDGLHVFDGNQNKFSIIIVGYASGTATRTWAGPERASSTPTRWADPRNRRRAQGSSDSLERARTWISHAL
ncbi:hypothetical protein DB30_01759 [Enhygromyxa salina]|uniref:Uncharacterized protein n=1 Tax=Enhygromyxa salina TaxID=215803 RepID=A0A0C2CWN1_9BACT|nr:hypothetical protein DB30_01759 [Enhygromyxa salina]